MRKKNSILNIISSIVFQLVIILVNLITQRVFLNSLGQDMLGLRGLFNNIITVLSLAELGLGTAIVYSMYKPLAQQDHKTTCALLNYYAKIYHVIAATVTALGVAFLPFIGFFIKDSIDVWYARVIFMFFIARTVITYLFSYKVNLFVADQKRYVYTNISLVFTIVINVAAILILHYTKHYILFLSVNVALLFLQNIVTSMMADHAYPYIKERKKAVLDKGLKSTILKNSTALVLQRVGSVCVEATDNMVLARMTSLGIVGLLSNYNLIIMAVRNLMRQFFSAVTASIGNLAAEEKWNELEAWFWRIMFANFWLFGFGAICLFTLLSPFVGLWLGSQRILEPIVVFLLSLNFYLIGMNQCTQVIRDGAGLYRNLRLMPLLEGLVNLIVSIVLAHFFGVIGVLLGTLIGFVTCSLWVQPFVVFREAFQKSQWRFYRRYALYFIVTLAIGAITVYACGFVVFSNKYVSFIAKMAVCSILPNACFMALFWKDKSLVYFRQLGLGAAKSLFNKLRTPKDAPQ